MSIIRRLICHFVVFVTILLPPMAEAKNACEYLFFDFKDKTDIQSFRMEDLRTVDPSKDHIEDFSRQIPDILKKLFINLNEAQSILDKNVGKISNLNSYKARTLLKKDIDKNYELLASEATNRIQAKKVTYEWYMEFFLRSMVLIDVTTRIQDSSSKQSFEILKRKVDEILGRSKIFFAEDGKEILIHSTLSREYSSLLKNSYFTRYLREYLIVPVLFVPKDTHIIEAESRGIYFVSLIGSKRDTSQGKQFPLKFAGLQMEQALKQIESFRNFTNPRSKWLKYHKKISAQIKDNAQLEALYAYILRDLGLQSELSKRFERGAKLIIAIDAHVASKFLRKELLKNQQMTKQIANDATIEKLLKIIIQIEKEGLASSYQN